MEKSEAWESLLIALIVVVGAYFLLLLGMFLIADTATSIGPQDMSTTSIIQRVAAVKDELEVCFLVVFIITTAYIMAKRSLVGEERIMVHRELTKEGDELKISFQILNKSTFKLRNVTLEVRTPQDVEIIQGTNTVDVGDIEAEEARNVVVTVRPTHFTTGTVTATLGYFRNKWRQVPVQPVSLGALYPFIEPVEMEGANEVYAGVGEMSMERQVFRFEIPPHKIFNAIIGRLQTATPIYLHAGIPGNVFQGFGIWVGRDPQSQSVVCIIAETKAYPGIKGGEIELTVYSRLDRLTSHYLTQMNHTLHSLETAPEKKDLIRELAGRARRFGL